MRPLYKTTIVIWSDFDPAPYEIGALASEAETGGAYCSGRDELLVQTPETDEDWDDTEFFNSDEEEEDEEVEGEVCEECGHRIPDHTVLLKSNYHTETCSMYGPQDNI